jgi:uncharacterized protein YceK
MTQNLSALPKPNSGFSILEVLVVLMLITGITSVVMSGLGSIMTMQKKFDGYLAKAQSTLMEDDWIYNILHHVVPSKGANGESLALKSHTLYGLDDTIGREQAFELKFETEKNLQRLLYQSTRRTSTWDDTPKTITLYEWDTENLETDTPFEPGFIYQFPKDTSEDDDNTAKDDDSAQDTWDGSSALESIEIRFWRRGKPVTLSVPLFLWGKPLPYKQSKPKSDMSSKKASNQPAAKVKAQK